MQKMKSENGVTIIALITTLMIMALIVGTTIYNSKKSFEIKDLTNLYSDIEMLEDRVKVYYAENNEFPIIETETTTVNEKTVYKMDFTNITNINGLHNEKSKFYIDTTTGKVYLADGVEYEGNKYYTIEE